MKEEREEKMFTVYKYSLRFVPSQDLNLPKDAYVLSVGQQGDALVIWALVNDADEPVRRRIHVLFTGSDAAPLEKTRLRFIGTVQMTSGLVVHVFEEGLDSGVAKG